MKIAVFGAGALGAVYGVRLAVRGGRGVDVAFVVRSSRVSSKEPIVIERVRGDLREGIDAPVRSDVVPEDADVVLLAVGTEDLDALKRPLETSEAPIVVLTPMLPRDWERVRAAFGDRVYAAMPSIVAYARKEDGVVRYWTPPVPTRIDEPRRGADAANVVRELAEVLSRVGLRARLPNVRLSRRARAGRPREEPCDDGQLHQHWDGHLTRRKRRSAAEGRRASRARDACLPRWRAPRGPDR